jgi:hypothetical protein
MRSPKGFNVLLCAVLCLILSACGDPRADDLQNMAFILQDLHHSWVRNGRPKDIQIDDYAGRSSTLAVFALTNYVVVSGRTNQCRFGIRNQYIRPGGLLCITEDAIFLWIRDSDGRVTISPDVSIKNLSKMIKD